MLVFTISAEIVWGVYGCGQSVHDNTSERKIITQLLSHGEVQASLSYLRASTDGISLRSVSSRAIVDRDRVAWHGTACRRRRGAIVGGARTP